jgi:rubrerythrin
MKAKVSAIVVALLLISGSVFAGTTSANLKGAIKGETTASAKYAAYAVKAREEGYDKIALLFEAAAMAESIHAGNHRAVLQQQGETMEDFKPEFAVKSTRENLKDALTGESYEVATMYPEFLKVAKDENANLALISFNYAYQTEKKHAELYRNALAQLDAGKADSLASQYFVCLTCGSTYDNAAPERCDLCMTPKERFVRVS